MQPPGLSVTDGTRSCSSCRFFHPAQGWCWQFDYPVKAFNLSDGFSPSGPSGPAQVFGPPGEEALPPSEGDLPLQGAE